MKRPNVRSTPRDEVEALKVAIQQFKPYNGPFEFQRLGQDVATTHQFYNKAFELGKRFPGDQDLRASYEDSRRYWYDAIDRAYPPNFWKDIEGLPKGDSRGREAAIHFLEADPFFFRTGYLKARLIRKINQLKLSAPDTVRLRHVVLSLVDRRDDRDFRAYCRLARKVDSPELRADLAARLTHPDANVRRRARWVLDALEQPR